MYSSSSSGHRRIQGIFLSMLITLDVDSYMLKDRQAEQTWNFNLEETLKNARKRPLLQGYGIYVTESTVQSLSKINGTNYKVFSLV